MYTSSFDCEKALKYWAKVIRVAAAVFMGLCGIALLVFLSIDDLWWIGLVAVADGLLTMAAAAFFSNFVWGFGDLVGNSKRALAQPSGAQAQATAQAAVVDDLPEL